MRSLFVKILLWFILTVVVAVSGTFYVSNVLMQRQQPVSYTHLDVYKRQPFRAGTDESVS